MPNVVYLSPSSTARTFGLCIYISIDARIFVNCDLSICFCLFCCIWVICHPSNGKTDTTECMVAVALAPWCDICYQDTTKTACTVHTHTHTYSPSICTSMWGLDDVICIHARSGHSVYWRMAEKTMLEKCAGHS